MLLAALTMVGLGVACTADRTEPSQATTPVTGASPSATLAPAGIDADFPTTVRDYAEATVGALAAPDLARLAELATPEVHAALVELPGPPDHRWSFVTCDEDAPVCAFHNTEGDELVVRIDPDGLGTAQAATDIAFDPTRYPRKPLAYLEEFLDAWQAGNVARMRALAAPEVVEFYHEFDPGSDLDFWADDDVIVVSFDDAEIVTEVDPDLLGGPGAIVAADPPPA